MPYSNHMCLYCPCVQGPQGPHSIVFSHTCLSKKFYIICSTRTVGQRRSKTRGTGFPHKLIFYQKHALLIFTDKKNKKGLLSHNFYAYVVWHRSLAGLVPVQMKSYCICQKKNCKTHTYCRTESSLVEVVQLCLGVIVDIDRLLISRLCLEIISLWSCLDCAE